MANAKENAEAKNVCGLAPELPGGLLLVATNKNPPKNSEIPLEKCVKAGMRAGYCELDRTITRPRIWFSFGKIIKRSRAGAWGRATRRQVDYLYKLARIRLLAAKNTTARGLRSTTFRLRGEPF